jgi:hypothetical protein
MRPGPKVNPLFGPLQRLTVLVDETTLDRLRALGGGNLSEGVRQAARAAYAAYQATPDSPMTTDGGPSAPP